MGALRAPGTSRASVVVTTMDVVVMVMVAVVMVMVVVVVDVSCGTVHTTVVHTIYFCAAVVYTECRRRTRNT